MHHTCVSVSLFPVFDLGSLMVSPQRRAFEGSLCDLLYEDLFVQVCSFFSHIPSSFKT